MNFSIIKRTVSLAIAMVMLSSSFVSSAATVRQTTTQIEENITGEEVVLSSVTISSVKNTAKGIKITWKQVEGAVSYSVVEIKNGAEGTRNKTKECSFVKQNVKSGSTYTFVVKAYGADNKEIAVSEKFNIKYVGIPTIKTFLNKISGTKIYWSACKGAAKYEVSYLNDKKVWKVIEVTDELNCLHDGLKTGKSYKYRVRCLDKDGKALNEYSAVKSNRFVAPVKITGISNGSSGVILKWKKVTGVSQYKIYKKTGKGAWKELATTKKATYTDRKVTSNTRYDYSIAALDKNKKAISVRKLTSGIKYIEAPRITRFKNIENGTEITWTKSNGASKYRIYYKVGNGNWNYLATVKGTTYTHKNLKNGKNYSYKVKCLDSKNNFISGARDGRTNLYVAPVKITGVSKVQKGTLVKWNNVKGVEGYRVFRKVYGGEWKKIGQVFNKASFTDTTAKKDVVYAYSVRAINKNGYFISAYYFNEKYYRNSKIATGIIGSKSTGYFYAGKDGKINFNYVNGIEEKGVKWIVTNGRAKKVTTRADGVLFRAAKEVTKATNTSMTREQKLKACFDYVKGAYIEKNPRIPHYLGMDWPLVYADDMLIRGVGNCCSYGSTFAFMAKAIGYTEVYCCNSGGHGWAEIDGLVYDPEWSRHRHKYSYYALSYDTKTDQNYKGAIAAGKPWMRIKI